MFRIKNVKNTTVAKQKDISPSQKIIINRRPVEVINNTKNTNKQSVTKNIIKIKNNQNKICLPQNKFNIKKIKISHQNQKKLINTNILNEKKKQQKFQQFEKQTKQINRKILTSSKIQQNKISQINIIQKNQQLLRVTQIEEIQTQKQTTIQKNIFKEEKITKKQQITQKQESIFKLQFDKTNLQQQRIKIIEQQKQQRQNQQKKEQQMKLLIQKINQRRKARQQNKRKKQQQNKQIILQNQQNINNIEGLMVLNDPLAHFQINDKIMDLQISKISKMKFAGYPNKQIIQRQIQQLQRINQSYLMIRDDKNNSLRNGLNNFRIQLFNRVGQLIYQGNKNINPNNYNPYQIIQADPRINFDKNIPKISRGLQNQNLKNILKNKIIIKQYEQCPICLLEIQKYSQVYKVNCGHIFHNQCLQSWLQNTANCPACRFNIKYNHP